MSAIVLVSVVLEDVGMMTTDDAVTVVGPRSLTVAWTSAGVPLAVETVVYTPVDVVTIPDNRDCDAWIEELSAGQPPAALFVRHQFRDHRVQAQHTNLVPDIASLAYQLCAALAVLVVIKLTSDIDDVEGRSREARNEEVDFSEDGFGADTEPMLIARVACQRVCDITQEADRFVDGIVDTARGTDVIGLLRA